MWCLLIIFLNLNGAPGVNITTVLQTYATSQECQSERDRVDYEMTVAYPDDRDFELSCRLSQKHGA